MYYYEKYDALILFLSMAICSTALFFFFKQKISSFIDPLVMHLVWCASGLALLFGYFFSKGIDIDGFSFVLVYLFYLTGLFFFLDTSPPNEINLKQALNDNRNVKLFFVSLLLNVISRYEFISYATSNPSVVEWFLYKFKQTESRSFVQYILQIGARPFFMYYTFVLIHAKKSWRFPLIVILLINVLLDIFAGGRSAIIGLILACGFYVYFFRPFFSNKRIKQINKLGFLVISLAIIIGAVVTSFYSRDATVAEGMLGMVNRLLAAGDGLEMYLTNHGSVFVRTGPNEYIKSVFGIFLKRIMPIESQSIGWQLYELEHGLISPIAVGPNYILPLQAFVLGKIFIPVYCLFISFAVAFLRGNKLSKKIIANQELAYVLGTISFEPVLDIELFVLVICSCLFIYTVFIYPVKRIKFVFDWRTCIRLNLKGEEA
jgi:oligosaccharide repeat unit polymerase